jgi:hypothetical protein
MPWLDSASFDRILRLQAPHEPNDQHDDQDRPEDAATDIHASLRYRFKALIGACTGGAVGAVTYAGGALSRCPRR